MSKCPVVLAISEIKGGFDWSGDQENDKNIITLKGSGKYGGDDDSQESHTRTCVLEDTIFYITTRKLTLARFKLSNPDLSACRKFYKKEFERLAGRDHYSVYVEILEKLHGKDYLYNTFTNLIDLIEKLESAVGVFIINSARKGRQFNLSFPSLKILPTIDVAIQLRPDLLQHTMNQIVNYMNKLNVNDLLKEPINTKTIPLPAPPLEGDILKGKFPQVQMEDKNIEGLLGEAIMSETESVMQFMEELIAHEVAIAQYIQRVEQYWCEAIQRIVDISTICQKIIDNILVE